MKAKIVSVGRVRHDFVKAGEALYLERLASRLKISFCEVESRGKLPEPAMKQEEARLVLAKRAPTDVLVVLDEHGKSMTSPELAKWLERQAISGKSSFCFAIGGAYGWDSSVLAAANLTLSLGPLTFTYQMARLILVEQLYRATTIIDGLPYHKI